MVYITVKQSPIYQQMTLEEFLFGADPRPTLLSSNTTNTRTYECVRVTERFLSHIDVAALITALAQFNDSTEALRAKPRADLYHSFSIPKRSGGLRRIDAPQPELMEALRRLKAIFEDQFGALYHTSAFAYVKHRCTVDAVKRHQANESKWFGKYDLSNFFGSTTLDFVMDMFARVFPFSEVIKEPIGEKHLRVALELAFLNGGLPQGTPISPLITNIMMIPIDFALSNGLRDFERQRFVYTRYADDFLVSSRYDFDYRKVENYIVSVLKGFGAPFTLNSRKTRYGSSAGSNWNLGVMLNKDNEITVGHKKKRQLQAMLASYVMDKRNGVEWDRADIQTMEGYRNYYRMVEGEAIDRLVDHVCKKFGVDIVAMIKADLSA